MAGGEKGRLRVLCLHGYRQTGPTFREKTGAFRKLLKKHVEFEFLTSPLKVPALDGDSGDGGGCGWWFSQPNDSYKAQDVSQHAKGYEESLRTIEEFVAKHGPFNGLLGFSQGGAMLGLLCGLQQQGRLSFSFGFAIFVSAFRSRSEPHQSLYAQKVMMPTLHVYGLQDQVIEASMSEEFLQYFHDPQSMVHPGGHFLPATGTMKAACITFLENVAAVTKE